MKLSVCKIALLGLSASNLMYLWGGLLSWLMIVPFILLVPGFLIYKKLYIRHESRWLVVSYSLALSLLILMLTGLLINSLHVLGIERPLDTLNLFIGIDSMVLILTALNRKATITLPNIWPVDRSIVAIVSIVSLCPVLAVFGAIRLNNGASNILTLLMLLLISVLFAYMFWRLDMSAYYPYVIMMTGLSLLLCVSLRSSYVMGHDIQREYFVFQLTYKREYWSMSSFRDPFNACMSITILPTIFSKLTSINPEFIYKVIYQIIFAIGLLPIYFFAKRIIGPRLALLCALIFISFPTFVNDITMLNRQEIAFVFFGYIVLTIFSEINKRKKSILLLIGFSGLILSHYSSSYVAIGILLLALLIKSILGRFKKVGQDRTYGLPTMMITAFALLFTFLWNTQITNTSQGFKNTITNSIGGIIDHSSAQSWDASYSLLGGQRQSPYQLLQSSTHNQTGSISFVNEDSIPTTSAGRLISKAVNVGTFNNLIRSLSAKVFQLLVFIGSSIMLVIYFRKSDSSIDSALLSLVLSCIVLLVLQTLLPNLTVDYGTLRFFQQTLIILAIPIIIALKTILKPLKSVGVVLVPLIVLILFLDLSGFIPQVTGQYIPQISLNDYGSTYDIYYLHSGEMLSANWLKRVNVSNAPIAMDQYAQIRMLHDVLLNKIKIESQFNPTNKAYFYKDKANYSLGIYASDIDDDIFEYQYNPNLKGRNIIYNNQDSTINGSAD